MEKEIRTCACGKQFEAPVNRTFRFCSTACGAKYRGGQTGYQDLTGQKFNMLTVVRVATDEDKKDLPEKSRPKKFVVCTCDCGKTDVLANAGDLKYGTIKSCGCARIKLVKKQYVCPVCEKPFEASPRTGIERVTCSNACKLQLRNAFCKRDDYVGKRFNRLTVLRVDEELSAERRTDTRKPLYLICKCDCGKEVSVWAHSLKSGQKSCGCHLKDKTRNDVYRTSLNRLHSAYVGNAKRRNLPFELSKEEFASIAGRPCHYCGAPAVTTGSYAGHTDYREYAFPATGVDRKDPSLGYTLSNCVPACTTCNLAKQSMTYDEFLAWRDRLLAHTICKPTETTP